MKVLRSVLFAAACALAITCLRAPLSAQSLTITAADKALYEEFLKTCAPQIDAMKKFLASVGESITDAQLRDFLLPMPAMMRESAKAEKMTLVATLREARAEMIKQAKDPNNTDKSTKVLEPTATCLTDLMIAKETGQTPRAPAAAPAGPAGSVRTAPATPAASPVQEITNSVCAADFTRFTQEWQREGKPVDQGRQVIDEILSEYTKKGPDRDNIIANAARMRADAAGSTRFEVGAAYCAATTSASIEKGTTDVEDLRALWTGRRDAMLKEEAKLRAPASAPAPELVPSNLCPKYDPGTGKRGEPALLRNTCDYAIVVAYCVNAPTPGSSSDAISCQQSRYTTFQIAPRSAALLLQTDGAHVNWQSCQAPYTPRAWWSAAQNISVGQCEKR